MEEDAELVTVSVTVPREHLGELYRQVAVLNEGGPTPSGSAVPIGRVRPWEADDVDVAGQLYKMVSPNARRIIEELMELGGAGSIGGAELATQAGIDKGAYGVAGSLSSVGKAATKVGRELPYRTVPNVQGGPGIYGMEQSVADLFRAAGVAKGVRS